MTTEVMDAGAEAAANGRQSHMGIKAYLTPKTAVGALTPDKLKAVSFISTYDDEDPQSPSPKKHGYQRNPMKERFSRIGSYYLQGNNRDLVTPIIVSVRVYDEADQKDFDRLFNAGDVEGILRKFGPSVFSIVDGQHRLNGLYDAWKRDKEFNAEVPVMLFYGLNYTEEAALFDDINTNQRKLPKALIEVTKVYTEQGDTTHAHAIREISFSVATDGDSVWDDKINMTGARDPNRSVTYEGLRRATSQMFPDRLLDRLKARGLHPKEVAKKYWALVASACETAWSEKPEIVRIPSTNEFEEVPVNYRLKDLVGVASLARLGQDIITTSIDRSSTEEAFYDAMTDYVTRLSDVDWRKDPNNAWMNTAQAGFAGQKDLYKVLYNLVYLGESPGEEVLPGE